MLGTRYGHVGPDFSNSRDPIFSDSRDPIFNSRDRNRVLELTFVFCHVEMFTTLFIKTMNFSKVNTCYCSKRTLVSWLRHGLYRSLWKSLSLKMKTNF